MRGEERRGEEKRGEEGWRSGKRREERRGEEKLHQQITCIFNEIVLLENNYKNETKTFPKSKHGLNINLKASRNAPEWPISPLGMPLGSPLGDQRAPLGIIRDPLGYLSVPKCFQKCSRGPSEPLLVPP